MSEKRIVVVVKERPNSRLISALAEWQQMGRRIRITDKPAPRIRDTSKSARKIDPGFVARALGADDWLDLRIVDVVVPDLQGLIHIVFKSGIMCLGSPDYSVEFGDDGGVKSFLGKDIVVRVYEEDTGKTVWPETK